MLKWIILSGCCLSASIALLTVGIAVGLWRHYRKMRGGSQMLEESEVDSSAPRRNVQRRRVLSPFQWFLAFFFLGAAFIFLPVYVFDSGWEAVAWIRNVLLSVHNAMRLFILDGDFEGVRGFLPLLPSYSGPLQHIS